MEVFIPCRGVCQCMHFGFDFVFSVRGRVTRLWALRSLFFQCSYCTFIQDDSGSYVVIAFAVSAVLSPRSFCRTDPYWFTTNVITPLALYSAGHARMANPPV